jgi:predicted nucleic-acid-binding Zn-ribbon protein
MNNICPKCNSNMSVGLALIGQEKDPDIRVEYDFRSNEDLELNECWKCPKCGHSETLDNLKKVS